jgi:hypothetical protein
LQLLDRTRNGQCDFAIQISRPRRLIELSKAN